MDACPSASILLLVHSVSLTYQGQEVHVSKHHICFNADADADVAADHLTVAPAIRIIPSKGMLLRVGS